MSDTLYKAMGEVRQQLVDALEGIRDDPRMEQIVKLHQGLNTLEELTESTKTSLSQVFAEVLGLEPGIALSVRPGEFYGRDQLKAAKMYLKRKGEAGASFDEIVRAIKEGGAKITSEEKLRVSLGRSTLDIAKVGTEHYALLEFYPHAQRGNKRRKSEGGENAEVDEAEELEPADGDLTEPNSQVGEESVEGEKKDTEAILGKSA